MFKHLTQAIQSIKNSLEPGSGSPAPIPPPTPAPAATMDSRPSPQGHQPIHHWEPEVDLNLDHLTAPPETSPAPQSTEPTPNETPGLQEQLNRLPDYTPPTPEQVVTPDTCLRLMHELDQTGREILSRTVTELRAGRVTAGYAARLLSHGSPAWQGSTGWKKPVNQHQIVIGLQALLERPAHAQATCPECTGSDSDLHQQITLRLNGPNANAAFHSGAVRECLTCGLICNDLHFWDIQTETQP